MKKGFAVIESKAESALVKMTGRSGLDNVPCSDLLCSV